LIITDQQRYDTIAALGYPHAVTPNLDRLVREDTHFESCYITAPSCVPSRASLFTGLYPHSNGVICNLDGWRHSWVERLADSGYRCVNIGKMHTWAMDAPCGFHQRPIVENKERIRKFTGSEFIDEWDKALATHGLQRPLRMDYRKLPDTRRGLAHSNGRCRTNCTPTILRVIWRRGGSTNMHRQTGRCSCKSAFLVLIRPTTPSPPPSKNTLAVISRFQRSRSMIRDQGR
jgi:hypothetical protein